MLKKSKIKYIFLCLYVISILVFFYFTLQSGDASGEQSSIVTNTIIKLLKLLNNNWEFEYQSTHNVVRKLVGHYGYSILLGFLGFLTVLSFRGRGKITLIITLVLGLFLSASSELLQFLPSSRGPSLIDVIINFFGEETGILIGLILSSLKK